MDEESICCWLSLALVPRLSNLVLANLLEQCSEKQILSLNDESLISFGFKPAQIAAWHKFDKSIAERCLNWAAKPNCHILVSTSPHYPYLLKQIYDYPKLLFVEGDPTVLSAPQIAIVGSRKASAQGLITAYEFAQQLVWHDATITSGLALGIDGKAHEGAINANGKTIAVLGSGLSVLYPKMHGKLAEAIKENGALVSEQYPWKSPHPSFFPKRNRIISGLSTGVLVVEAAERSGSLITARLALEQGRDVFALPSAPNNLFGKGSNALIKQGAFLVESVQDILSQVTTLAKCAIKHQMNESCDLTLQQELPFPSLLANVGEKAKNVDMLASVCQQPVHEIMIQLLELELQGLVVAVPGGYIRTRRS